MADEFVLSSQEHQQYNSTDNISHESSSQLAQAGSSTATTSDAHMLSNDEFNCDCELLSTELATAQQTINDMLVEKLDVALNQGKLEATIKVMEEKIDSSAKQNDQLLDNSTKERNYSKMQDAEIHRLQYEVDHLTDQLEAAVIAKCDSLSEINSSKIIKLNLECTEEYYAQEKKLHKQQIDSLTKQLESQNNDWLAQQRDYSSRFVQIETKLTKKIQELSTANENIAILTECNTNLKSKTEELYNQMEKEKANFICIMESHKLELQAQREFANLHKSCYENSSKHANEMSSIAEDLKHKLSSALEEYGDLETKHRELLLTHEEVVNRKTECISMLNAELTISNELVEKLNVSLNDDENVIQHNIKDFYNEYKEAIQEANKYKNENQTLRNGLEEVMEALQQKQQHDMEIEEAERRSKLLANSEENIFNNLLAKNLVNFDGLQEDHLQLLNMVPLLRNKIDELQAEYDLIIKENAALKLAQEENSTEGAVNTQSANSADHQNEKISKEMLQYIVEENSTRHDQETKKVIEQQEKLRKELQDVLSENVKLVLKCEMSDETVKVQNSNMAQLQQETTCLNNQIKTHIQVAANYETSCNNLSNQLRDMNGQLNSANAQIQQLNKENASLKEAEVLLKNNLNHAIAEQQSFSIMLQYMEAIKARFDTNLVETKSKLMELIVDSQRECAALRRRLQDEQEYYRSMLESLQMRLNAAEKDAMASKTKADLLLAEINAMKMEPSPEQAELSRLKQLHVEEKSRWDSTWLDLNSRIEGLEGLNRTLMDMPGCDELIETIRKLEEQVNKLNEELSSKNDRLEFSDKCIADLTEKYDTVNKEYKDTHAKESQTIRELQEANETYVKQIYEAQALNHRAIIDGEELSSSFEKLRQIKDEMDAKMNELTEQNTLLLCRVEEFNNKLSVSNCISTGNRSVPSDSNQDLSMIEGNDRSSEQFVQIIKYLRHEKDCAMGKSEQLAADYTELCSQHEILKQQYINQIENGCASDGLMVTPTKHSEILQKLEAIQALTQNNHTLRAERDLFRTKLDETRNLLETYEQQIATLQENLRETQKKADSMQTDNITQRGEAVLWRQRAKLAIEKGKRINAEEFSNLQRERDRISTQLDDERKSSSCLRDENTVLQSKIVKQEAQAIIALNEERMRGKDKQKIIEALRQELIVMQKSYDEKFAVLDAERIELQILISTLEPLRTQISDYNAQIELLQRDVLAKNALLLQSNEMLSDAQKELTRKNEVETIDCSTQVYEHELPLSTLRQNVDTESSSDTDTSDSARYVSLESNKRLLLVREDIGDDIQMHKRPRLTENSQVESAETSVPPKGGVIELQVNEEGTITAMNYNDDDCTQTSTSSLDSIEREVEEEMHEIEFRSTEKHNADDTSSYHMSTRSNEQHSSTSLTKSELVEERDPMVESPILPKRGRGARRRGRGRGGGRYLGTVGTGDRTEAVFQSSPASRGRIPLVHTDPPIGSPRGRANTARRRRRACNRM